MNYIKQLTAFYQKANVDKRLSALHMSLYNALFQFWNINHFINPIILNRSQILNYSKIGSFHSYYKCLSELNKWGYIEYFPSNTPLKNSYVKIREFNVDDQTVIDAKTILPECKNESPDAESTLQENKNDTLIDANLTLQEGKNESPLDAKSTLPKYKEELYDAKSALQGCIFESPPDVKLHQLWFKNDTMIDAKMHPYINNKQINIKTREREFKNTPSPDLEFLNFFSENPDELKSDNFPEEEKRKKVAQKKEKEFLPPTLSEINDFFVSEYYPLAEAKKFFYHYKANGWLVGGKTPMSDWQAAVHNWMFKVPSYETAKEPGKVNLNSEKDYGEPL